MYKSNKIQPFSNFFIIFVLDMRNNYSGYYYYYYFQNRK